MMIKPRHFIFILVVLVSLKAPAQRTSTFENWFSFGIQKKMNDFTFAAEEGWRVREFAFSRQNYTDLSLTYKFNKHFDLSAGYRLALKTHMFNISEANNRVYIEGSASMGLGDFEFSYRAKFQYTEQGREDDINLASETYVRNRFKVKTKLGNGFSAGISYEAMILLSPAMNLLNENRLTLGLDYKINKKNIVSLGYVLRSYVQVNDPLNVHIISLDYLIKL